MLLEGTPPAVDLAALKTEVEAMPNVRRAYDPHAWTLTWGFDAMSGRVVVDDFGGDPMAIRAICGLLNDRHGIEQITIQVEDEALAAEGAHLPV